MGIADLRLGQYVFRRDQRYHHTGFQTRALRERAGRLNGACADHGLTRGESTAARSAVQIDDLVGDKDVFVTGTFERVDAQRRPATQADGLAAFPFPEAYLVGCAR